MGWEGQLWRGVGLSEVGQTLRAVTELCQRRTALGTSVEPTPKSRTWGQGGGRAGTARLTSPNQGLFNCSGPRLWEECLTAPNSHRGRQGGTMVAEKFLGYIFFLFRWPEATEVGQTAKGEILQSPLSFGKSPSPPLLSPPLISPFLFPSQLLGQMEFGEK